MTGEYLQAVKTLGVRTAEFHRALAEEKSNPAFKPVKATAVYTEQLAESVIRQVQEILPILNAKTAQLPAEVHKNADRVLHAAPELLEKVEEMTAVGEKLGQLIRHHGDYHLGQILRTKSNDFILLDFEGEPLRSMAERRRKGSPLKDIAGMIRSFSYAAETALGERIAAFAPEEQKAMRVKLNPWGRVWYEWISNVFVGAYFKAAAGAPFLPTADIGALLEFFLLEKAFYELKYEMNNRPGWLHIPLAGIVEIIDRKKTGKRKRAKIETGG